MKSRDIFFFFFLLVNGKLFFKAYFPHMIYAVYALCVYGIIVWYICYFSHFGQEIKTKKKKRYLEFFGIPIVKKIEKKTFQCIALYTVFLALYLLYLSLYTVSPSLYILYLPLYILYFPLSLYTVSLSIHCISLSIYCISLSLYIVSLSLYTVFPSLTILYLPLYM